VWLVPLVVDAVAVHQTVDLLPHAYLDLAIEDEHELFSTMALRTDVHARPTGHPVWLELAPDSSRRKELEGDFGAAGAEPLPPTLPYHLPHRSRVLEERP
jgi:hypothetical protein